ncbi:MAG TPA: UDP-glucuronic acid decarboxylase family protein [Actinomycetota bacterium]|nr:UDP-glucuronic acid decarboxylase family protein [Actinomycetota bacterium]
MRVVVTGGAGFLGSHLCERLLNDGHEVVCFDSLLTGSTSNVAHLQDDPAFELSIQDVTNHIQVDGPVDFVMHLASPASPVDYARYPIETLKVGSAGTLNCLGLAKAKGAGFFLSSTSEVYGDPQVHPQPETYWGNVNPIGPRACYDEAKRYAEALTFTYHRTHGVPVRVVRIFNTHGPRMRRNDGRAVPTFIDQCLAGRPITVHGDGNQTRSLCYVDDLIEGFIRLLAYEGPAQPVNIGNPGEATILEIAGIVKKALSADSEIIYEPRPVDDPQNRRPDLTRATELLGWEPKVSLEEGLRRTAEWCRSNWKTP